MKVAALSHNKAAFCCLKRFPNLFKSFNKKSDPLDFGGLWVGLTLLTDKWIQILNTFMVAACFINYHINGFICRKLFDDWNLFWFNQMANSSCSNDAQHAIVQDGFLHHFITCWIDDLRCVKWLLKGVVVVIIFRLIHNDWITFKIILQLEIRTI